MTEWILSKIEYALYWSMRIPHLPRQWWYNLYVRKDKFHHSLDLDVLYMMALNEDDRKKYLDRVTMRRNYVYSGDLSKIKTTFVGKIVQKIRGD